MSCPACGSSCWHRARGLGFCPTAGEAAMLLDLPDLKQRDGWSCGRVAATVVLQFFGKPVPRGFPTSPIDGTDPLSLPPVFRRAGLMVQAGEMTAADLRHQTRCGRPVVCLVRHHDEGHYVVVRGLERNRVHYHCPASGRQSELLPAFLARWWDVGRDAKYDAFAVSVWEK